jgi:hypothetical protein
MLIHCDRCKKKVEGDWHLLWTSGFYDVSPPSSWAKYARPYETIVCDCCMWKDPGYIKDYGFIGGGCDELPV